VRLSAFSFSETVAKLRENYFLLSSKFRVNGTELKEVNIMNIYSLAGIVCEEVFRETYIGQIFHTEVAIARIMFRRWS
jgi:hypothetical protein